MCFHSLNPCPPYQVVLYVLHFLHLIPKLLNELFGSPPSYMNYFLFDWNLCSYLKVGHRSLILEVGCGFISLLYWEFSKTSAVMRLNPVDSRIFHNKANAPVVMTANKLHASKRDHGPLEQDTRMRILSNINDLVHKRAFSANEWVMNTGNTDHIYGTFNVFCH